MDPGEFSQRFKRAPVLGIIRGISKDHLDPVLQCSKNAGLKFLEITMNTEAAPELIRAARQGYGSTVCIGAGTVLSITDAQTALDSGAQFLVSPTINTELAEFCNENKVPYFPGAFTPTEIETAWSLGACMVKVFPASLLGPRFFKEMKGPFRDIPLMAVGGVRVENVAEYLQSGASALAFGASVYSLDAIKKGCFAEIQSKIEEILLEVNLFFPTI